MKRFKCYFLRKRIDEEDIYFTSKIGPKREKEIDGDLKSFPQLKERHGHFNWSSTCKGLPVSLPSFGKARSPLTS